MGAKLPRAPQNRLVSSFQYFHSKIEMMRIALVVVISIPKDAYYLSNFGNYAKFFQKSGNLVRNIALPHENFPSYLVIYKSENKQMIIASLWYIIIYFY